MEKLDYLEALAVLLGIANQKIDRASKSSGHIKKFLLDEASKIEEATIEISRYVDARDKEKIEDQIVYKMFWDFEMKIFMAELRAFGDERLIAKFNELEQSLNRRKWLATQGAES